jgi:hypothetical protein
MRYSNYVSRVSHLSLARVNTDGSLLNFFENFLFTANESRSTEVIGAECDPSSLSTMSDDGRFYAFTTKMSFDDRDTDAMSDCYIYDMITNSTIFVSTDSGYSDVISCGVNGAGTLGLFNDPVSRRVLIVNLATSVLSELNPSGVDPPSPYETTFLIDTTPDAQNLTFMFYGVALDNNAPDRADKLTAYFLDRTQNSTTTVVNSLLGITSWTPEYAGAASRNSRFLVNSFSSSQLPDYVADYPLETYVLDTQRVLAPLHIKRPSCPYRNQAVCANGSPEDYQYSKEYRVTILDTSSNGNIVLFSSEQRFLPGPTTNETVESGYSFMYIFNRLTNETHEVINSAGQPVENFAQGYGTLSRDGVFAYFVDSQCNSRLYRWDIVHRVLLSFGAPGSRQADSCLNDRIRAILSDGTILFYTTDSLVPADTDAERDLYAYTPTSSFNATLLSKYANGTRIGSTSCYRRVVASSNARFVIFESSGQLVFLDRQTGTMIENVHISPSGEPVAWNEDSGISISNDGRYVGILSRQLIAFSGSQTTLFIFNTQSRQCIQATMNLTHTYYIGEPVNVDSMQATADGRFWIMITTSSSLGESVVLVYDRQLNTSATQVVTKGLITRGPGYVFKVSDDGSKFALSGTTTMNPEYDLNGVVDGYSCSFNAAAGSGPTFTGCVMMTVGPQFHGHLGYPVPTYVPPPLGAPEAPPVVAPVAAPIAEAAPTSSSSPSVPPTAAPSVPSTAAPKAKIAAPTVVNEGQALRTPLLATLASMVAFLHFLL